MAQEEQQLLQQKTGWPPSQLACNHLSSKSCPTGLQKNCAAPSISWHPDNENLIGVKVSFIGSAGLTNLSPSTQPIQANLGVQLGKGWKALGFPCFSARYTWNQEWRWDSLSAAFPSGARKYMARDAAMRLLLLRLPARFCKVSKEQLQITAVEPALKYSSSKILQCSRVSGTRGFRLCLSLAPAR